MNMFTPFFRNIYLVRVYRSRLGWDIKWRPILAEFEVLHIQRHYISPYVSPTSVTLRIK
ncbi:hypothetical protein CORMATOL_01453 [Corynebacterium matruchotii ATCC 33806]|uniref:Uncharacterized protein n=1 Tax=Corynebacterium matruchotii ATCC 33806 TaxID=566549 RepID=C0E391_9CORY|nr:hypothetical protein CORMATOL_01453 [Corynebacterium matruchotii ATCC 33806]